MRALELRRTFLPANDASIAVELNNLGMLYQRRKEREKAIECLKQAVAILDEYGEITKPNLADPYDNLAALLLETGAIAQARTACQRALDIRDRTIGKINAHSVMSLKLLSDIQTREKPHARATRETAKECYARMKELAKVSAHDVARGFAGLRKPGRPGWLGDSGESFEHPGK